MGAIKFSETWSYNGYFGGSRDVVLVPGDMNADARDVFCRGHCHSLALALIELRSDAELNGIWANGELEHVFVRLPDGSMLDANGVASDEDEMTSRLHGADYIAWLDEEELDWVQETGHFRRARVEDAMPFARALLRREGIPELAMAA